LKKEKAPQYADDPAGARYAGTLLDAGSLASFPSNTKCLDATFYVIYFQPIDLGRHSVFRQFFVNAYYAVAFCRPHAGSQ